MLRSVDPILKTNLLPMAGVLNLIPNPNHLLSEPHSTFIHVHFHLCYMLYQAAKRVYLTQNEQEK